MSAGRPTLYRDDCPEQARRLALLGLTDEEIASFFEIDPATLYRWDEAHPEFREARAGAREMADGKVAEKLYHRALGYSHPSEKIFMNKDGEVVRADIVEHYPPDTQAATWWLKNRQGKRWKDKTEVEHGGSVSLTTTLDALANKVFGGE
jgi:hypothetical protein